MEFYRNRVSLDKITAIEGVRHDTVDRTCHRGITAIQKSNLCIDYLKRLTDEANKPVKQ